MKTQDQLKVLYDEGLKSFHSVIISTLSILEELFEIRFFHMNVDIFSINQNIKETHT